MTRTYKTLENAQRGFNKIARTWASWLEMEKKMWIVKYHGVYTLLDYSPIIIEAWKHCIKGRIIDMDEIERIKAQA